MSGGSYNYMSQEMSDGRFDKFTSYQDQLVGDLKRLAASLADSQVKFETWVLDDKGEIVRPEGNPWGAEMRPFTPEERMLAGAGIGAAISAIAHANKLITELGTLLASLADVAHEVEWWRSGDTSQDQCAFEIASWLKKKAGIP
jgi:hypothetical protein